MITQELKKLIETLQEATEREKITWDATSDHTQFVVTLNKYSITLYRQDMDGLTTQRAL